MVNQDYLVKVAFMDKEAINFKPLFKGVTNIGRGIGRGFSSFGKGIGKGSLVIGRGVGKGALAIGRAPKIGYNKLPTGNDIGRVFTGFSKSKHGILRSIGNSGINGARLLAKTRFGKRYLNYAKTSHSAIPAAIGTIIAATNPLISKEGVGAGITLFFDTLFKDPKLMKIFKRIRSDKAYAGELLGQAAEFPGALAVEGVKSVAKNIPKPTKLDSLHHISHYNNY